MKFDKKEVDALFAKTGKGVYEYRKARLVSFLKSIGNAIFAVTIFPLLILRDFFMSDDCK